MNLICILSHMEPSFLDPFPAAMLSSSSPAMETDTAALPASFPPTSRSTMNYNRCHEPGNRLSSRRFPTITSFRLFVSDITVRLTAQRNQVIIACFLSFRH